ncbi:MAG: hypothetical protein AAF961_10725, partial [Planctomycetota bacterium]
LAPITAMLESQDAVTSLASMNEPPLHGELARSAAFEFSDSGWSSGDVRPPGSSPVERIRLPGVEVDAPSVSTSAKLEREERDDQNALLAAARWPLVFSATIGLLLGGWRRSRSEATQEPPRM